MSWSRALTRTRYCDCDCCRKVAKKMLKNFLINLQKIDFQSTIFEKTSVYILERLLATSPTNCLNFGGSWRSDFWIFPKNFSIDLLHRSWNSSYCYFFLNRGCSQSLYCILKGYYTSSVLGNHSYKPYMCTDFCNET